MVSIIKVAVMAMTLAAVTVVITACAPPDREAPEQNRTGVYLGIDPDQEDYDPAVFEGHDLVILDAQLFTREQISGIRDAGVREIWSYIDAGSLETYRSYCERFRQDALDPYEGWPDEFWVDVSDAEWQNLVTGELASEMAAKGVDGFFVDNADVYYHYQTDDIYDGLENIFRGLDGYGLTVTVNGGDTFVQRLLDEKNGELIDGVCQECVRTSVENYEEEIFGTQSEEDREYFEEYLSRCRAEGLDVMTIEYTRDPGLRSELEAEAGERGERIFVSGSLKLDR